MNKAEILIIDDEAQIRKLLEITLESNNYSVNQAENAKNGLITAENHPPDMIILDLGLPDCDGLDLVAELARRSDTPPIIVITARDSLTSRLAGLHAGADDYLVKPFDLLELHARVHAVHRRPRGRSTGFLSCGHLKLDLLSREGFVGDRPMALARREAAMLEVLLRAEGRTVVRDVLEERLYSFDEPVTPNAIEAVVSRLRRKLEALGSKTRILTNRGIGYRMTQESDGAA